MVRDPHSGYGVLIPVIVLSVWDNFGFWLGGVLLDLIGGLYVNNGSCFDLGVVTHYFRNSKICFIVSVIVFMLIFNDVYVPLSSFTNY